MLSAIRALYRHMQWADALVWRAVLDTPAAAHDAALREKLLHIHTVQRGFFTVWNGGKPEWRKLESFADNRALMEWSRAYYAELEPFLETLDEDRFDGEMNMPWARHFMPEASATSFRDTLMQAAMHSAYHRGQVNTRIRELGGTPSNVDYIMWCWKGRPQPSWP
jgi:uncharacterized damage-inducible protein DinB